MNKQLDRLYQLHNKIFNCKLEINEAPLTLKQVKSSVKSEYKRLVNALPICIHEISTTGRVTMINPAGIKMLGLKKESDVIGTEYLSYISDSDRLKVEKMLSRAIIKGEQSTFKFTTSHGKTYSSCFTPVLDCNGNVEKILGFTEDITEYTK